MKTIVQQCKAVFLAIVLTTILVGCGSGADTPETFFNGIKDAAEKNDPSAVWETLPSSMQSDVDSLAHDFGEKIPADFYDSTWELVRRISSLLESKREFVLNTPTVKMGLMQLNALEQDQFEASYDQIVPMINALSESQLSSAAGLKQFNMSSFLSRNGNKLTTAIVSMLKITATQNIQASDGMQVWQSLSSLQVTVVSEEGDTAIVQTTVDLPDIFKQNGMDDTEKVSMTKVDGKWIPSDLHNRFAFAIADAKRHIATTDFSVTGEQMMVMSMMVGMADAILQPFEQSNTQQEFDNAVMQLMTMF
jgi:hypothetical protein